MYVSFIESSSNSFLIPTQQYSVLNSIQKELKISALSVQLLNCHLLSFCRMLMASSIIQSGENPAVFDNNPNNEAIFSLTDGSFSWNKKSYCYLDTLLSANQKQNMRN